MGVLRSGEAGDTLRTESRQAIRAWMARRGIYLCRRSQLREIMRPVPVAIGERAAWGLCDGIHRDDHEFVPA